MTFAIFAGICHFLSLNLLQQLLLAADLITAIPSFTILLTRILQNFNVSKIVWQVVVTRSPRFFHSVPLLKSLHWLPVRYRIIFKICTITYQPLSSKQPAYLHSVFTPARQPRQLQLSGSNLLSVPRVKTNAGT